MLTKLILLFGLVCVSAASANATITNVDLRTADSFAVLAGSTVTNTGSSTIFGSVGVSPGTALIGFPPGLVSGGTLHGADAVTLQAQQDLVTAYGVSASEPCGTTLTGQDLGGLTLSPGVYCFATGAQLTGTLTLDAHGDPTAQFVFQTGSTLTAASSSTVALIGGGSGEDVFWQVGSSATLGAAATFEGSILALTSITLDTGANIGCGRALARNGAVTLDGNQIAIGASACGQASTVTDPPVAVDEPAAGGLLAMATLLLAVTCLGRRSQPA